MNFEENVFSFVKELNKFDYRIESADHIWEIIFPDKKGKWHYLYVTKYQEAFYLSLMDDELCTLEVIPEKSVQVTSSFGERRHHGGVSKDWNELLISTRAWFKPIKKTGSRPIPKLGKTIHSTCDLVLYQIHW